MNKENQIEEMLIDLLTEFDEMGFAPTVLCHDPEGYAVKWKEMFTNALKGYRRASEFAREIDDLVRHILLNEDIAIKCKRENGRQNEEYWKGKISAYREIRTYIDAELKKKHTEGET